MIYRRLVIPSLIAIAFFALWVVYSINVSADAELKGTIQGGASNFLFALAGIAITYTISPGDEASAGGVGKVLRDRSSPIMLAVKSGIALPFHLIWASLVQFGLMVFIDKLEKAGALTFTSEGYEAIQKEIIGITFLSAIIPFYAMFMFHAGSVSRRVSYIPVLISSVPSIPIVSILVLVTQVGTGAPTKALVIGFAVACLITFIFCTIGWGFAKLGHWLTWRTPKP